MTMFKSLSVSVCLSLKVGGPSFSFCQALKKDTSQSSRNASTETQKMSIFLTLKSLTAASYLLKTCSIISSLNV